MHIDYDLMAGKPRLMLGTGDRASIGVILTHGFTSAPANLNWQADHLHAQGYTTYTPRLFAHATDPHHLQRARAEDWLADMLDAYYLLDGLCDQIVLVGHSMGGVLSLIVAANRPVCGVVGLAVPSYIADWRVRWGHWLRFVRPMYPIALEESYEVMMRDQQAQRGLPIVGRYGYTDWSTMALRQLYRAIDMMLEELPKVAVPVLLINSSNDQTVPLDAAERIARHATHTDVERLTITRSGHGLPTDVDRDEVYEKTAAFIARITG